MLEVVFPSGKRKEEVKESLRRREGGRSTVSKIKTTGRERKGGEKSVGREERDGGRPRGMMKEE